MLKSTLTLIAVALLGLTADAQQEPLEGYRCEVSYENRNQVDYEPLSMRTLAGIAVDKDDVSIPQMCLGLFTEKGHRFVASTVTDEEGKFNLSAVPPGRYRLVAKYNGFCSANVPIRIVRELSEEEAQGKRFVVLMKLVGRDSCSYGLYR